MKHIYWYSIAKLSNFWGPGSLMPHGLGCTSWVCTMWISSPPPLLLCHTSAWAQSPNPPMMLTNFALPYTQPWSSRRSIPASPFSSPCCCTVLTQGEGRTENPEKGGCGEGAWRLVAIAWGSSSWVRAWGVQINPLPASGQTTLQYLNPRSRLNQISESSVSTYFMPYIPKGSLPKMCAASHSKRKQQFCLLQI